MTEIGIISEPWLNSHHQEDNNSFTVSTLMSSLICKAVLLKTTWRYTYIYIFFWIGCFRMSLVLDYPCWVYHKLSGYRLIILFMIKQCSSKFCFQFMMKVLLAWIFCFWLPNIQNLDQQSYNILCRYFLFYLHFTVTTWVIMTCYSHCLSADKSKDLSSSSI